MLQCSPQPAINIKLTFSGSLDELQLQQRISGTVHPHFEIVLDKEACVRRLVRNDEPGAQSDASKILLNSDVAPCRTFPLSKVRTVAVQPASQLDDSSPVSRVRASFTESKGPTGTSCNSSMLLWAY